MMPLRSNTELAIFLAKLADDMNYQRQPDLATALLHAARFASGSPSEFFHEAQSALRAVREAPQVKLTKVQTKNIDDVIGQIESAFRNVGGA